MCPGGWEGCDEDHEDSRRDTRHPWRHDRTVRFCIGCQRLEWLRRLRVVPVHKCAHYRRRRRGCALAPSGRLHERENMPDMWKGGRGGLGPVPCVRHPSAPFDPCGRFWRSRWRAGGRRAAAEDYEPENGQLGRQLFWLGIVVLDVLFVLFVLWLFAPSLVLSQKIFSSMGGALAVVVLDIGIVALLIGYSRTSSVIRL